MLTSLGEFALMLATKQEAPNGRGESEIFHSRSGLLADGGFLFEDEVVLKSVYPVLTLTTIFNLQQSITIGYLHGKDVGKKN